MTSVSQRLRRHARGRRTGRPSKNRRCLRWEVPQIDSLRFFGQIFTPEISPVRYIDMKYRLAIYRNLAYRTGLPEMDASLLKYFGTKWSNILGQNEVSSHLMTKNLSGLRKGLQLCRQKGRGELSRRWTVSPLLFLKTHDIPVGLKMRFSSSPAHWPISCFYRQR